MENSIEKLLDNYSMVRNKIIDKTLFFYSQLIEQLNSNQLVQQTVFDAHITILVTEFEKIQKESEHKNNQTSCDFNIFRMFRVGETMHSYILAHFLNPNSDHGQKHLFLNVFLDLLKIKRITDNENWIVTAEKGRIDLLLKRNHPPSVVVIENKSNYAVDQENQLYRYWYQEIYSSIISRHLPEEYILNPPEDYYQLIYLSPTHWKIPTNNSLTKPQNWGADLPDEVPIMTKQLLFNEFIVEWLKISLAKIPSNNSRIREHIEQYLEYWNN